MIHPSYNGCVEAAAMRMALARTACPDTLQKYWF